MDTDIAALAEAERAEWRTTCDDLHERLAAMRIEADRLIANVDAADQRARSLDAALTAEREAGKGLVAQVEQWRAVGDRLATIAGELFGPFPVQTPDEDLTAIERGAYDGIRAAQELAAIRDLVAPGNPQGTVVDAVRARLTHVRADAELERDAAIARAEKAEAEAYTLRSAAEENRGALVDVADNLFVNTLGVTSTDVATRCGGAIAKLTAERDALRLRVAEDERDERATDAELAKLRAEVAELRARPVLTVEAAVAAAREADWSSAERHDAETVVEAILAALGPVTLPSPDRAEELLAAYQGADEYQGMAWRDLPDAARIDRLAAMRTALAKLSPAPAPSLDAAFLRRTLSATKHGPGGKGGNGPCDAACVKCEAERMLADAPAREAAPTDRVLVHADGGDCHGSRVVNGRCVKCGLAPDSQSTELWEPAKVDRIAADHAAAVKVEPTLVAVSDEELRDAYLNDPDDTLSGIRAVRAKLGAAEVTEERLAGAIREAYGHAAPEFVRAAWNHLRATAAKGG